jgi:hypothetical protein
LCETIAKVRGAVFACLLVACASDQELLQLDPCAKPLVAGGTVEIGLGSSFASITDGEYVPIAQGTQNLWQFTLNARTQNLDVGSGGLEGVVAVEALDQTGSEVDFSVGVRSRDFMSIGTNCEQMTEIYNLSLDPRLAPNPDGQTFTIQFQVTDHEGRKATDQHSVTAQAN